MSKQEENEGYIIVVTMARTGLRAYVLQATKDQIAKFWDFWKGRK